MLKEKEDVGQAVSDVKTNLEARGMCRAEFFLDESFVLPKNLDAFHFNLMLTELADNCGDCGATKVLVTLRKNKIAIEDNVKHEDADKIAERLNSLRSSKVKNNPKKWQKTAFDKIGGVGISEIVLGILESIGGTLKYSVIDNERIAAEISW